MTTPVSIQFTETQIDQIASFAGRVAVVVGEDGKLGQGGSRANRLSKGAVKRFIESDAFEKLKDGDVTTLAWPVGMEAEALDLIKLPRRADVETVRRAGAALARCKGKAALLVLAGNLQRSEELALGIALRAYSFTDRKSAPAEDAAGVTVMCSKPEEMTEKAAPKLAVAEGVFFTRDLVSEPANYLTTTEFANRLEALTELGVEVEVLDEDKLEELGMGSLLSVGQGSASPSKVVVMQWKGAEGAPLALVGKGVVFDTGGISLKPAAGMEDKRRGVDPSLPLTWTVA